MAPDGAVNFAPMGVEWGEDDASCSSRSSRPPPSATCAPAGVAVVNLTDDVMLFARARSPSPQFPCVSRRRWCAASCWRRPAPGASWRWWRSTTRRPARGSRPGWCTGASAASSSVQPRAPRRARGGHPGDPHPPAAHGARSAAEFARLQVIVDKTAGPREQEAMAMLTEYVRAAIASSSRPPARLHFGVLDLRGALGRRFGGLGAAIPHALAAARGGARTHELTRRRDPTPTGRPRSPSASWRTTACAGGARLTCTGRSRRTAGWARAPSWGWPWPAPWPSCTGSRPNPRRWRGRFPGAGARRSGPGHSLWAASSWRGAGDPAADGIAPLLGALPASRELALRGRGAPRAARAERRCRSGGLRAAPAAARARGRSGSPIWC